MDPNVNYGLWVLLTCQRRFINCNKGSAKVWDVKSAGGRARVATAGTGGNLYFLPSFAVADATDCHPGYITGPRLVNVLPSVSSYALDLPGHPITPGTCTQELVLSRPFERRPGQHTSWRRPVATPGCPSVLLIRADGGIQKGFEGVYTDLS